MGAGRRSNLWLAQLWADLHVYVRPRALLVMVLGFSSGLPILLIYSTLSAWLSEAGVSKTAIGLFSWASLAYGFKFLWSPLVDRMPLPVLSRLLGQRRAWMLVSQLLVVGAIFGMAGSDPANDLMTLAVWAVVLAFGSATQDIVIDAYRIEILHENEQGVGAANVVFGYRIGMLVAGAGALLFADFFDWQTAYIFMAVLMGVGITATLLSKEPKRQVSRETIEQSYKAEKNAENLARVFGLPRRIVGWGRVAVVEPFSDFATNKGWIIVLAFVAFYKYGDALLGVMAVPFYLETGFSKTEIAAVSKGWGLGMTLLGAFFGGVMVYRLGILRALLWAGVLQAGSNLIFAVQAYVGYSVPMLAVTIGVENLAGGMATAAFVAYLSSLTNVAYTATQYALLSSFMAQARIVFASGGGWLADQVDWVSYFLITTGAAVPGLLLLLWLMRLYPPESVAKPSPDPA